MYIRKTKQSDFDVFIPAYHDVLEAEAMGITPGFPDASECVTLDHDGEPIAIGGNQGDQVWFVTSAKAWWLSREQKVEFRRKVCEYRDIMLSNYQSIWNYVWVGNVPHIRFLKSIGAVFHEEYTQDGKFQLFTITRS